MHCVCQCIKTFFIVYATVLIKRDGKAVKKGGKSEHLPKNIKLRFCEVRQPKIFYFGAKINQGTTPHSEKIECGVFLLFIDR